MSGNREGGIKARDKNLANNPNFYRDIGSEGGKKTAASGKLNLVNFRAHPDRARSAGAKGGKISSRTGVRNPDKTERAYESIIKDINNL